MERITCCDPRQTGKAQEGGDLAIPIARQVLDRPNANMVHKTMLNSIDLFPGEYGIKQKPWFCLMPSFWIGSRRGRVSAVHFHSNGEAAAHNKDIEPVPRFVEG